MNKYVLVLAYDGSLFGGWQTQHRGNSVQEVLQNSFYDTFKKPVKLIAASRTDVGVHALGQVVLCKTEFDLPVDRLLKVWNDNLPASIVIQSLKKAKNFFHPWYNVFQKCYIYRIFCSKPTPFVASYGWHVKPAIDWARVKMALEFFVGMHDFKRFKHAQDDRVDTIREIKSVNLYYNRRYGAWSIEVKGKSFLRHMIRKIVGAVIFVGTHPDVPLELLQQLLITGTGHLQFPTAPACGLLLRSIEYTEVISDE